jgi:hypothetical protein
MRHEAIRNLYPTVVTIDDTAGAFDAQGNLVTIDESLVTAEIARLQADYEAKAYQRSRATSYPSIQEQLDMQYWDSINGTTTWADAIAAVKQQYPKPE